MGIGRQKQAHFMGSDPRSIAQNESG